MTDDIVSALPATPIPESTVASLDEGDRIELAKPVAFHYRGDTDEDLVSALVLGTDGGYYPIGFDRTTEAWRVVADPAPTEDAATEALQEWQEDHYGIDR